MWDAIRGVILSIALAALVAGCANVTSGGPAALLPDTVTLQSGTPRTLPNLKGIPIVILTGEASYHAPYDHCTAKYLTQAGVTNEHVRLEKAGFRGNGHGIPSERNSLEVAAFVNKWLQANVR